ncbi:MAG TPA: chromosomal replication initiator protein DnaA, partial [Victivallales bacterium]|nr:chromosomal replication initiator protein DnaA [Victivallales bacterium]
KDVEKLWKMEKFEVENLSQHIFNNIKERINNPRGYDIWIKPVKIIDFDGEILHIQIPNRAFYRGFFPFLEIIKEEFSKLYGFSPKIDISYGEEEKSDRKLLEVNLNPEYTFENFIVGPCNRLAHAAALAVAQSPGIAYNPLFIYGKVGLGKTHLMQAIGHYIKNRSDLKMAYIPAEFFVNEYIQSIKNKTTYNFRNKFRNLDFLLIDDIHFIAGKGGSQEEFFHTFNFLYDNKKQMILSSDRPPKEITAIEERIISRFEWGLVVDLQPPDFETRVAILKKKAEIRNIVINDDIIFLIAEKVEDNIRVLEGILNRILALSKLTNSEINEELVNEIIDGFKRKGKRKITLETIMEMVCNYFNISEKEIKSGKRIKNILIPRQIAMYLSRDLTTSSLNSIGEFFGIKDHTTVINACKKVKKLIENDTYIKNSVENIKRGLSV